MIDARCGWTEFLYFSTLTSCIHLTSWIPFENKIFRNIGLTIKYSDNPLPQPHIGKNIKSLDGAHRNFSRFVQNLLSQKILLHFLGSSGHLLILRQALCLFFIEDADECLGISVSFSHHRLRPLKLDFLYPFSDHRHLLLSLLLRKAKAKKMNKKGKKRQIYCSDQNYAIL